MALKSTLTTTDKYNNPQASKTTEARKSKLDDEKKFEVKKKHIKRSKSKELLVRKRLVTSPVTKESLNENNFLPTASTVPYNIMVSAMSTFYPPYPNYTYVTTLNEWNPVIPPQSIYSVPVIISPTQILATQLYPYVGIVTQPVISPVVSQVSEAVTIPYSLEPLVTYATEHLGSPIENVNIDYYFTNEEELLAVDNASYYSHNNIGQGIQEVQVYDTMYNGNDEALDDPLGFYLTLPKELFPSARTLYIDPNPIIDEFCKISNLHQHTPWILDLEFGIPKSPITRIIPAYNVKFNSINCKNTPDAIHPGFESCSQDFKKVLLFYYDCVVSTWYKGYMAWNHDKSVENFQSWLIPPVQVLGMCWS